MFKFYKSLFYTVLKLNVYDIIREVNFCNDRLYGQVNKAPAIKHDVPVLTLGIFFFEWEISTTIKI